MLKISVSFFQLSGAERGHILLNAARLIRDNVEDLGKLISRKKIQKNKKAVCLLFPY